MCVQNEEIAKLDDARQALAGVVPIDYVIDCQYDAASDGLFMLTGTYGYTHPARSRSHLHLTKRYDPRSPGAMWTFSESSSRESGRPTGCTAATTPWCAASIGTCRFGARHTHTSCDTLRLGANQNISLPSTPHQGKTIVTGGEDSKICMWALA